ncbi:ATP-binding protein [Rubritalea sp.]|uniref:ATP-binding protein n=1 Tax=Rubritalea sp. TaxID=2109375 RepID=UPI003EF0D5F6
MKPSRNPEGVKFYMRSVIVQRSKRKAHYELKRRRKRKHLRAFKNRTWRQGAHLVRPKTRKSYTLSLPKVLCVRENLSEIQNLFNVLEVEIFVGRAEIVIIDHQHIERATPEAVLLLISQLVTMRHFAKKTRFSPSGRAKSEEVEDLLGGLGYNDYFSRSPSSIAKRKSLLHNDRIYIRHRFGESVDTQIAAEFVEEFAEALNFGVQRSDRLKSSLGECIMNAINHAYPLESQRRWIEKRWWILGYTEKESGKAYFVFLDRGVGMPATIKPKLHEWGIHLFKPLPTELVIKAFEKSRSQTKLDYRGRGLPLLKHYAEESHNGRLFVQTDRVRVIFEKKNQPQVLPENGCLDGTLLVWEVDSVHVGQKDKENDSRSKKAKNLELF